MQNIDAVTRLKMIIDAVRNGYIKEYNSPKFANVDIYVTKCFIATRGYDADGNVRMSSHNNMTDELDVLVSKSTGNVIISSTNGMTTIDPSVLEMLV